MDEPLKNAGRNRKETKRLLSSRSLGIAEVGEKVRAVLPWQNHRIKI